ncbi:MAG TPA: hypothetical protein VMT99_00295 [Candidatus Paceibacterota bacterium]|nr:hypothetical protein [Candidatus Paceibacterota bacterium]
MSDAPNSFSFEQALESDMRQLAAEIEKHREAPEMQSASEQDLIRESLRALAPVPRPQQAAPANAAPTAQGPLPAYADAASPETKLEIEYLIDVALKQGIGKAFDESAKSPYFVQDAFHDALAGRLYPELQRRGIVK